jgi:Galactose oxidase-like, Early set domain/Cep192 domain 4/Kelch motif
MPGIRWFFTAAIVVTGVSLQAQTGPSLVGEWKPLVSWPSEVTHASLLANGKVLVWPPYNLGDNARVWDPATNTFVVSPKAGYNIFCTGHTHLADGRLLVSGGQIGAVLYGVPNASIYDPTTDTWTRLPDMESPRWYPTNTALANGDILVTSGQIDPVRGISGLPQIWQAATATWQDLSSAQLIVPLYPRMLLAPNGKVFYAGEAPQSRYLDTTGTGQWTLVAKSSTYRDYGSAIQYGDGKILIVGGGNPPTATAEVIDLNAPTPAWRLVGSMAHPRRQLNATLLPNGQVLVTGGTSGKGFNDQTNPVFPAEVWDPKSENWTTLSNQTGYRGYHSVALLLPDATVLVAGGDPNLATAQIYWPPYLFKGTRPAITSAPSAINYGGTFTVGSSSSAGIAQVTWLRLGSVTHAFNQDQHFNNLSFTVASSTQLKVTAPTNPNLAPPGYYMMFLINSSGVPSVARFIRLNTKSSTPLPVTLAPSSIFMPNTVVGTKSISETATLSNNQSVPLTISNIAVSGDFLQTNKCTSPITAHGSCTFTVTFKPTATGLRSGTIAITDGAANSPQTLNLAGNGVGAATTTVTSHIYGQIAVGTSASYRLYLINNQTVALNITGITVSGGYSQTNHCVSPLGAGQYCDITVTFAPTAVGLVSGVLTIKDNANNSPQTVTLTGTGK